MCNFLTLFHLINQESYVKLADGLINAVHDMLGYTRDGSSRLPGVSDSKPLEGGLRIGKFEASGPDGDGQYYHYLRMWMFAPSRMSITAGEKNITT